MEIVNIDLIKPTEKIEIKEILPIYAKLIQKGIVDLPIIVDKKTTVILEGHKIFQALELLSVKKAPVLKVDIWKSEIKPLIKDLDSKTKQAIINAGLYGPKLPSKSFKLLIKIPNIRIPLEKLLEDNPKNNKKMMRVYNNTIELLCGGWPTPFVKFNSLSSKRINVWCKLEGYNPFSGSIKDRIGFSMITEAIKQGEISKVLYEATSTNTGIALSSIANISGIKTKLFIPKTIQKVSDIYLKVLGAEVRRLPVGLTVEAIKDVDSEARKNGAFHLNQFENDSNFKIHLKHTAMEIDEQSNFLDLTPSCIIGGLGTSGHMSAISFYFKKKYGKKTRVIGVQPGPNEIIPGIRRIETGMKWIHWAHFDEIIDVKQSEAIEAAITIARKEGLLIGLSSGAVIHAFEKIDKNKGTYVLILPDTGYKYAEQFEKYFFNKKREI